VVNYRLARPIVENRNAFKARFPEASYKGDRGDRSHMKGSGDHTPYSSDRIFGKPMARGIIYAQDLGGGGGLAIPDFARFVLDRVRDGAYPEIKYVITRHSANHRRDGGKYFGLFDRRYSWRTQFSSGHTDYIHVSYMPGFEERGSRLVADFHDHLHGRLGKAASAPAPGGFKRWRSAPPLPAFPLGRYSQAPLSRLPYIAYPPLAPGYGGPEAAQAQRDIVTAILRYAVETCRTTMVTPGEIDRAELGTGFLSWAHMIVTSHAGNEWRNDPVGNGRTFGAAIGAPASW
jgi:hypothetical protein